jgi:hypothetical protein
MLACRRLSRSTCRTKIKEIALRWATSFKLVKKLIRLLESVPQFQRKLDDRSRHRQLFLLRPKCLGLRPFDRTRAGGGECPVWQSPKQPHPISNNASPECGQSSKSARPTVNVYQKSRLRFLLQNRVLRPFLVHSLDASVNPRDADPLQFGTISIPETVRRLIVVI